MLYLDATVFLYPALYEGSKAKRAVELLEEVATGTRQGVTASLTYDEVVWKVAKHFGRVKALDSAEAFLAFPHLRILSVGAEQLRQATRLMSRYARLDPRDAIHAATALSAGVKRIASDDADYDDVPELERVTLNGPQGLP